MNRQDILNTRSTLKGLCKLARELGYVDPAFQLMNSDGSVVGDLLCFFEDNPGAIDAVIEWTVENHSDDDEEEDADEEETFSEPPVILNKDNF